MSQQGIFNTGSGPLPPASPPGYGQVYNTGAQAINNGNTITFDSNGPLLNITHVAGSDTVTVNAAGTYMVTWIVSAQGDGGGYTLLQNGVAVPNLTFVTDPGNGESVGNGIVNVALGDTFQLRNNTGLVISLQTQAGFANASISFEKMPSGGASSGTNTFVGNTGSATQVAGIINLLTANSTVLFSGAGNTITQDFNLSNLVLGSNLAALTTGVRNVGLGSSALFATTSGNDNTAVGFGALTTLVGANNANTAVGSLALTAATGGSNNTAIGDDALTSLLTGSNNIAVGRNAGSALVAGESSNIYVGNIGVAAENNTIRLGTDGNGAGQQNTTVIAGDVSSVRSFTAIAGNITASLGDMVITSGNLEITTATAAGGAKGIISYTGAGDANRFISARGTQNFFAGYQSGNTSLTVGSAIGNTGVGFQALEALTTGAANTVLGQSAGTAITTGSHHVAIGLDALDAITGGSDNVVVGDSSGTAYTTTESNNIILGANITGTVAESNKIRIGNASNNATFITGIDGVNVGSVAKVVTMASDQLGTATITAGTGITVTPGANTITIAASGGSGITTINGDTGSVTGATVSIIGNGASSAGSSVSFSGSGTTLTLHTTDASSNTIIGLGSGNATPGGHNTGLGGVVLTSMSTGSENVGVGYGALNASNNSNNTALGYFSLVSVTTGSGNTALGWRAGANYTGAETNNILIGGGTFGTAAESNTLRIGTGITRTFIQGIDGVNVGSVARVVTEASDQLGTAIITAGTNTTVTAGANTITIAALGGGAVAWSVITANQTAAVNNGYFCNKAGTLALALPATSAVGDVIEVTNENTALGVQFTQAAGQQILLPNNTSTTLGATGTLTSSAIGDSMKIVCKTANTIWRCVSMNGNWTPA